jgi:hypothetical protein
MLTIRLPKADWGKTWRAMIEVAPVRLVANDPVYEVLPAHLELLTARGFTYEVVPLRARRPERRNLRRLARESAKLDLASEQTLADEGLTEDGEQWPDY